MKPRTAIAAGLILACTTVLQAQQVTIGSLEGNGQLTVNAPSNSDFTVEWASSLTPSPIWRNNWIDLQDIQCTNGTMTLDVPMFYRVTCWTNGVLWPFPIGRVFVYAGETNDLYVECIGKLWVANTESVYSYLNHWQRNIALRSTADAIYLCEGGIESLWMQTGELGTTWTNAFGEVITLVTNETITVQAGTFDCLKYRTNPDGEWTDRWLAPGVGLIKEDWPDSTDADYELKEYYDN